MSVLEIENLSVLYQSKKREVLALDNFNAKFCDGMNVVMGSSGCGKTTLLRSILGLTAYDGKITLNGTDLEGIETKNRNFSFVSQDYTLFPQYTVFDNIAFPLKVIGAGRKEITERVYEIAELTELTACLTRKPKYISGGQQQRAAVARALVKRPAICLMDEPFSNTDEVVRTNMRRWIKKVFAETGCMAIYITHDFKEALAMADKLIIMNNGKLEICGTPEDVFDSGNAV
ncbi:MAG: ABC transporter ATP-binding protein, partial [Clostridia bacterium]|nr:ABC transporter ATP-binding protein [Clostridia bacterium]